MIDISSKQIAAARAILNLTQDEFALECGFNRTTIVALEKGSRKYLRKPTIGKIHAAFKRLNVHVINSDLGEGIFLMKEKS